jgi:hypothetical protein
LLSGEQLVFASKFESSDGGRICGIEIDPPRASWGLRRDHPGAGLEVLGVSFKAGEAGVEELSYEHEELDALIWLGHPHAPLCHDHRALVFLRFVAYVEIRANTCAEKVFDRKEQEQGRIYCLVMRELLRATCRTIRVNGG